MSGDTFMKAVPSIGDGKGVRPNSAGVKPHRQTMGAGGPPQRGHLLDRSEQDRAPEAPSPLSSTADTIAPGPGEPGNAAMTRLPCSAVPCASNPRLREVEAMPRTRRGG